MTAALPALIPPAAALLAVLLTAATGLDQRTALPPAIEARFYGFFLDSYPLFCVALVYGLARLGVAVAVRRAHPVRRVLGGAIALLLLLAAGLYPTFGGLVLRAAFATGGSAFLTQQTMPVAYGLGAAAAAFVFGTVLALGSRLVGRDPYRPEGWARRVTGTLLRILALWFALGLLGLAHAAGFGSWPRRPLSGSDTAIAALLVLIALLPHTCLDMRRIPRIVAQPS